MIRRLSDLALEQLRAEAGAVAAFTANLDTVTTAEKVQALVDDCREMVAELDRFRLGAGQLRALALNSEVDGTILRILDSLPKEGE